jgi:hypothetical protein
MDISLDCLFYLLGYLEYDELLSLFCVNKYFYGLSLQDSTWQRLLQGLYPSIQTLPGPNKYKDWREYYDVVHTNARLYHVDIPMGDEENLTASDAETYMSTDLKNEVRRGDVVHFGSDDYRNCNKYLWNGVGLDELGDDEDDYGHLPSSYTCNEFINPYRWFSNSENDDEVIDHNTHVWFDFNTNIFKVIERTTEYVIIQRDSQYYTFVSDPGNGFPDTNLSGHILASASQYGDAPRKLSEKIRGYCLILF